MQQAFGSLIFREGTLHCIVFPTPFPLFYFNIRKQNIYLLLLHGLMQSIVTDKKNYNKNQATLLNRAIMLWFKIYVIRHKIDLADRVEDRLRQTCFHGYSSAKIHLQKLRSTHIKLPYLYPVVFTSSPFCSAAGTSAAWIAQNHCVLREGTRRDASAPTTRFVKQPPSRSLPSVLPLHSSEPCTTRVPQLITWFARCPSLAPHFVLNL